MEENFFFITIMPQEQGDREMVGKEGGRGGGTPDGRVIK